MRFGKRRNSNATLVYRPLAGVFCAIFLLVLVAAFNTNENLLYLVAACAASFLISAFILTRGALRGVHIVRDAPASVHRREPFVVKVRIENRKRLFPSISLQISDAAAPETLKAYVHRIPPATTATLQLHEMLPRRGLHTLSDLLISSGFPLGLFQRRMSSAGHGDIVVYPRVLSLRPNVVDQIDDSGSTPRPLDPSGDEFFALREYVPGDDIRYICWRVSARVGQLIVRQLEPSTARSVVIVFDTRGVPDTDELEEQFEEAVDLAASLAIMFLEQQYAVAIVTPDTTVGLGRGSAHGTKILEMLARVESATYGAHRENWHALSGDLGGSAKVFVSSDPATWGDRVTGRGVHVLDPREAMHA